MKTWLTSARALLVATAFGLLAIAAMAMYAKALRTEISGGEKVAVLMVTKAIKAAEPVQEDALAVLEIPTAYVDDRLIRASDKAKVLGLRAERELQPQEMLEWRDLALSGNTERLLGQIVQPGSRALTLHVPAQYMSIELIRPGDYVDLIAVLEESRGAPQSVVLLQRVLVLAVGAETTPVRERGERTREDQLLTVSVTLQESQAIALATQKGPVIAVLRNASDSSVMVNVSALKRLTTREPAPAAPAPPRDNRPKSLNRTDGT